MSSAAQTSQPSSKTTFDTSGQALVLRPKGRGPNARRDVYDSSSRRYMSDLRPQHEQSNTLLARLGVNHIDEQFRNAPNPINPQNSHKSTKQPVAESFPALNPFSDTKVVTKQNPEWVTTPTSNDAFTGPMAPVPESKKKNTSKTKIIRTAADWQVLSKATTNDAVDNLNFQEERETLLAEVERWKEIAEERANFLDEMEWEIGRLKRELDDAYDRCD